MGIHGFFKIKINDKNKLLGDVGNMVSLKKFKDTRICIDASLIIYQSILALEKVNSLTDKEGNTTVHLNTIFNKILQLKTAGATQIWVFDSPNLNDMKKHELARRKERREKSKDGKGQYKINKQHIDEVQTLLTLFGITYVVAPDGVEAEQLGAFLTRGFKEDRFCQYMLSSDSDVLMFGGNLLRSKSEVKGKTKKTVYYTYDIDDVLNELDVSIDNFIKMGVLLGSDFNDKAPGVGPGTVMKKYSKEHITPAMVKAQNYFKSDISGLAKSINMITNDFNKEKLIEFLVNKNFNKEKLTAKLNSYE